MNYTRIGLKCQPLDITMGKAICQVLFRKLSKFRVQSTLRTQPLRYRAEGSPMAAGWSRDCISSRISRT